MKKKTQLGMDPGTASNKLIRDLLFDFVIKAGHKCFRCGNELSRDDFSIDHKDAWLDSDNPQKNFFSLSNIAFSHFICNNKAARKRPLALCGTYRKYFKGCRCDACIGANREKVYKWRINGARKS